MLVIYSENWFPSFFRGAKWKKERKNVEVVSFHQNIDIKAVVDVSFIARNAFVNEKREKRKCRSSIHWILWQTKFDDRKWLFKAVWSMFSRSNIYIWNQCVEKDLEKRKNINDNDTCYFLPTERKNDLKVTQTNSRGINNQKRTREREGERESEYVGIVFDYNWDINVVQQH